MSPSTMQPVSEAVLSMKGSVSMTTARIIFKGQLNQYGLFLPQDGEPEVVAKTLKTVMAKYEGISLYNRQASNIAADFIRNHPYAVLTPTDGMRNWMAPASYVEYIVYSYENTVSVRDKRLGSPKVQNDIPMADFFNWGNPLEEIRKMKDKVVTFVYKGGSGQHKRLVKLTDVEGTGDGAKLKGWDVNKSTANKPAYRNYIFGNIVGKVEVVNY